MFWNIFFFFYKVLRLTINKLVLADRLLTKFFFIPTCKLIYLVKLQSFHFASIKSQSLATAPPTTTTHRRCRRLLFTSYLPFLFPLHHLSSAVMVVSSPSADLFMSNGCVWAFFLTSSTQAAWQPAERTVTLGGWVGVLEGVGVVIWDGRPSHYRQAYRDGGTLLHCQIKLKDRPVLHLEPPLPPDNQCTMMAREQTGRDVWTLSM